MYVSHCLIRDCRLALLARVRIQQKDGIMAILAAVLHISDIEFKTDPQTDGVFVTNDDVLVLGRYSHSRYSPV